MGLTLQNARASDELQRAHDIVGRIKLRLDETVVPVHVIGEVAAADRLHPELYQPVDVGWFSAAREDAAGGVGILSSVSLTNPAGSGVIAIVHDLTAENDGGDVILRVEIPAAQVLDNDNQTGAQRDTRYLPSNASPSACTLGDLTTALPAGRILENLPTFATSGAAFVAFRAPVVLGPGTRLLVNGPGDMRTKCNFVWTEERLPRRDPAG